MNTYNTLLLSLLLLYSIVSFTGVSAQNVLRQVHIITQHGASYPLNPKHPDETELTATGEKQMYDLGVWIKRRYIGFLEKTDPDLVHFESCASDRAVTGANAIAMGLFNVSSRDPNKESQLPNGTILPRPNIPVYTPHYTKANDVTFRSYDTCNAYQSRLTELFKGEIKNLAEDSQLQPILRKLSQQSTLAAHSNVSTGTIALQDIGAIVDIITVAKLECDGRKRTPACHALPNVHSVLTDNEWTKLQRYAYDIEKMKFTKEMAGTMLGAHILQRITSRMMNAYSDSFIDAHVNLYSAQDTTLWGIVAALGEYNWLEESGGSGKLTPPGSALIMELYDRISTPGVSDFIVDLYYKPGNNDTATLLSTVCGHNNTENCKLTSLATFVDMSSTSKRWCKDCGNDSAEICLREAQRHATTTTTAAAAAAAAATPVAPTESDSICPSSKISTAGAMLTGMMIGMVATLFMYCVWCCKKMKKAKHTDSTIATSPTYPNETDSMFT
jgi:Histidine phosphatase superfamily (branch 2)